MRARVRVPVTVKMRIGVVERREREELGAIVDFNAGEFDALQGFRRSHCRCRLRARDRACPQGGARGLIAEGESRDTATAL